MERRKCRRCDHPMTRLIHKTIEPGGSRWEAWYACLSCGYETESVHAGSRAAAEDGLERFMERVDRAYETDAGRAAAPRKPQTAEADRALNAYGLYCQLCETLTGKPIAKLDELLTAAEYQVAAMRTSKDKLTIRDHVLNGALGLFGEGGEVADIVKKAYMQGHPLDKAHIAEELGDVC